MSKSPLSFRIIQGGKLVRQETLALGVIKIGKVPSAHLRIDDEAVSRMHAILEIDAHGVIQIIDLGSTRGTFVNGARVHKAQIVAGDTITVGDTQIEVAIAAPAAVALAPVLAVVPSPAPPAPPPPLAVVPPPAPVAAVAPPSLPRVTPPLPRADLGAGAVEVAAMLGDSVVEVKHCMDPRGGAITRPTYALLGASLVCFATAATAFVTGVQAAARNAEALAYWTHVEHKPAHAFRAESRSGALDGLEIAGLALGIGAAAAGLARARRERKSPEFRIGTAPGVDLATEAAPAPSFPLVAPAGDDFVFHIAPGMEGELTLGGAATSFAELAATGRARPSERVPGALELPIPAAARIRARAGAATFLVSAVARPTAPAAAGFALDGRAAMYAAASLIAHVGLYGLAQLGTADASTIGVDAPTDNELGIRAKITDHEETPPPPDPETSSGEGGAQSASSGKMALPEGAAGTTASQVEARMSVQDHHLDSPQIARAQAIAYARESGILGAAPALSNAINALNGTADLSNGMDTDSFNGALFGAAGEGKGNFGGGRNGWGPGGGCLGDQCGGIGVGRYKTIGNGPGAGPGGWGPSTGHGPGLPGHTALVPIAKFDQPITDGGIDKSIIRRYVKREQNKIAYCYEHELLAHPTLEGDITVSFFIAPDGSVRSATGAGFDATVASCVADVVHAIQFPMPRAGAGVQVNYPFHFHTAAGR